MHKCVCLREKKAPEKSGSFSPKTLADRTFQISEGKPQQEFRLDATNWPATLLSTALHSCRLVALLLHAALQTHPRGIVIGLLQWMLTSLIITYKNLWQGSLRRIHNGYNACFPNLRSAKWRNQKLWLWYYNTSKDKCMYSVLLWGYKRYEWWAENTSYPPFVMNIVTNMFPTAYIIPPQEGTRHRAPRQQSVVASELKKPPINWQQPRWVQACRRGEDHWLHRNSLSSQRGSGWRRKGIQVTLNVAWWGLPCGPGLRHDPLGFPSVGRQNTGTSHRRLISIMWPQASRTQFVDRSCLELFR